MILSDKDIRQAIKDGKISIEPYDENCIQPASVDLHLDKHFLVFDTKKHFVIDTKKPVDQIMKEIEIDEETPFVLHPREFALGTTMEITGVDSEHVARLEGKSSIGRL